MELNSAVGMGDGMPDIRTCVGPMKQTHKPSLHNRHDSLTFAHAAG